MARVADITGIIKHLRGGSGRVAVRMSHYPIRAATQLARRVTDAASGVKRRGPGVGLTTWAVTRWATPLALLSWTR
jgi:hypothetical protein